MIKKLEQEVVTGAIGGLAYALTNKSFKIYEDEGDMVSLTVRLPLSLKERIVQYSEIGNVAQSLICRLLIDYGLDSLDEALLFLQKKKNEESDAYAEMEESERQKAEKRAAALEALKEMRG